jgi:hypothetical protein
MVRRRAGASTLGCLVTLLIVAAVGYFAVNIGEVYWRYIQYRDAMVQTSNFARQLSDEEILRRLRAKADSLDLPAQAKRIQLRRSASRISLSVQYYETVEFPLFVRNIYFNPRAEATF